MSHPEQRASDAEREQVVVRLRDACADGRLTTDELGERVSRAYASRTLAELDALTIDLPRERPLPAPAARGARPRRPGNAPFNERLTSPLPPERVRERVLAQLAPLLDGRGYSLRTLDARAVVFEREERPGWTIAVAVLVFPLGLLALSQRRSCRIVVAFAPARGGGSEITIYGTAPLALRRAFAELAE